MKKRTALAVAALSLALAMGLCSCAGSNSASSSSNSSSDAASTSISTNAQKDSSIEATLETPYTEEYCEITFKSAEWLDEITYSGDHITFNVAEAQEGKSYLVVTCEVKNTNTESIATYNFMKATLSADKYNFDGKVSSADANNTDWSLDPLDTREFVIYTAVPNELKDKPITLKVTFSKDPSKTPQSTGNAGNVYTLAFSN